ncbi:MAG: hypothetical protein KDN22_19750 [Verrucomicrobiae bacterium]|nr:hypothetical protein [Verrucomicrobiae bacterium]
MLTTHELLSWVERRFPQRHLPGSEEEPELSYRWSEQNNGDSWRYLTGRRLAPQSADRYYKALVWRNFQTDQGLEADRKRRFINIPAPAAHLMPQLPAELGVTSDLNS